MRGYDPDHPVGTSGPLVRMRANAACRMIRRIVTLDLETGGIARVVGPYGTTVTVEGLAFNPVDGTLFAVDTSNNRLASVDLETGALTFIGSFLGPTSMAGLTFSLDGSVLYGMNFSTGGLFTIDPLSGAATEIGIFEAGQSGGALGLATDPISGLLFVAEWRGGANMTLAKIDPIELTRTLVGTMDGGLQIEGLTFVPVPEPSTLALLGSVLVVLALFSRKAPGRNGGTGREKQ